MPGLTLMTNTLPLPPISLASVSAAVLPPASLSEAICDTAMSGWSSVVSTSTILMPWSAICLIGAYSAFVSVGAISTASGFLAATALTIGVCCDASNSCGPWKSSVAPSTAPPARAARRAPGVGSGTCASSSLGWLTSLGAAGPPHLIEVDGDDQEGAHGDLLPEGLHADDHEAVLEHRGDEDAEHRAEDRADPAEQARPADHDRRDRVEVVRGVAADGRRAEAGEVHEPGQPRQRPRERVDLDEVAVDCDARTSHGLLVGSDGVRVAPEAGLREQDP